MPFLQDRPEVAAHAQASAASAAAQGFYSDKQATVYTTPANASIQRDLTLYALEIADALAPAAASSSISGAATPVVLLDLGAGSGLSTLAASQWLHTRGIDGFALAFDISPSMLLLTATSSRDDAPVETIKLLDDGRKVITSVDCGERTAFYCGNAAQKFPLRAQLCDVAIGISMLQWLTNDGLRTCYTSLWDVLLPHSPAVFQVYPTSPEQVGSMEQIAMDVGFAYAEVVVAFPHATAGRKWFFALKKTLEPPLEAALNMRARDRTLCPFGRRHHRRCAWHLFRDANSDSALSGSAARVRERLGREHVKEAWHIYRKYHRAAAVAKQKANGGKPLHYKALASLKLWTSDEVIGDALRDRFLQPSGGGARTTKISHEFLLTHMSEVVDIVHVSYSRAVELERSQRSPPVPAPSTV